MIPLAAFGMVAISAVMVTLLAVGAAKSARLAGLDATGANKVSLWVALGLASWSSVAAGLALSGVLSVWTARPPRWPFLPLTAVLAVIFIARTRSAKALIQRTPLHWPIAAQSFRIGVELVLIALYAGGRAPVQVTFEGRNFDILVGLTAPVVALLVARKRLPLAAVIAWNVAGLMILANTVGTVATSTPGPLHLDWPGAPFTALATWPTIWLPTLLVPIAIFLHVASLGQTRAAANVR